MVDRAELRTSREVLEAHGGLPAAAAALAEAITEPDAEDPALGEFVDDASGERVGVEVVVAGKTVSPFRQAPACEHRGPWNSQVTVADVRENPDGTGAVIGRQVRLKLRCALCGDPARFRLDTAGASRSDGDLGLVVSFEPVED